MNINDLKEILVNKKLLHKYGIPDIHVFGSLVRGEKNPHDIDLFVQNFTDYKVLISFKNELEALTGQKVDLVMEKYANPIIMHRAKKEMIQVHGA